MYSISLLFPLHTVTERGLIRVKNLTIPQSTQMHTQEKWHNDFYYEKITAGILS